MSLGELIQTVSATSRNNGEAVAAVADYLERGRAAWPTAPRQFPLDVTTEVPAQIRGLMEARRVGPESGRRR